EGRCGPGAWEKLSPLLGKYDVVACGPGWGQSETLASMVRRLFVELETPLVVDADGLNLLAKDSKLPTRTGTAPRIFTPHPGEFARLLGRDVPSVQKDREELAAEYARSEQVTLVLKGHPSVIT